MGGPGRIYGWCKIIGLRSLGAPGAAKLVPPSFRQMVVHGLLESIPEGLQFIQSKEQGRRFYCSFCDSQVES
jgi:hypothetical protein